MTHCPIDRLRAQIAAGELETDAAQLEVAARLDELARSLSRLAPGALGLFSFLSARPPRRRAGSTSMATSGAARRC